MIYFAADGTLRLPWIVTVEESLQVGGGELQLVLDRVSDPPEHVVGLAGPPAGQAAERPHHALLGGECGQGDEEEAEDQSHDAQSCLPSEEPQLELTPVPESLSTLTSREV